MEYAIFSCDGEFARTQDYVPGFLQVPGRAQGALGSLLAYVAIGGFGLSKRSSSSTARLFRLSPLLDDIKVWQYSPVSEEYKLLDNQQAPVRGGLRGRLKLHNLDDEGLLQDMVVAFEGMRFTSMDLLGVRGMQFFLETCAHTLETLCLHPEDSLYSCKRFPDP